MATGGEVPDRNPGGGESEDLAQVKCQPCLEIGELREVSGMCVDCDEYMCSMCFKTHRGHKPCRHHQLIDRKQMGQSHIRATPRDTCTEACPEHEDDVIKYYCLSHCVFGCTLCITQNHKTCEDVQFIPRVSKDLTNNKDYRDTENRLKSTVDTLQTLSENVEQKSAELEKSCIEALKDIREYRKRIDEALGKIENEFIEKLQEIKSKELQELASIKEQHNKAQTELQLLLNKISVLQNAQQNCGSYIEMMRTKKKLTTLDSQIAELDISKITPKIRFSPNKDMLDSLKQSDTFGTLSGFTKTKIVGASHVRDINVKIEGDSRCSIKGFAVLPGNRLVITDNSNQSIKAVNTQSDRVMMQLKLSSEPWDVTATSSNTVAVTIPAEKKIAMVTVGKSSLNIDRYIKVNGHCHGIDYKNDKLAVSYKSPDKVQVLSMQGSVLHHISNLPLNLPEYLTYGQDGNTLYVSNYRSNTVDCLKLGGTVVATYTDSEMNGPEQVVVDTSGDILVGCYSSRTIHLISKKDNKPRVLLSKAAGFSEQIYAVFLCEKRDMLYVGMVSSDVVKAYKITRAA